MEINFKPSKTYRADDSEIQKKKRKNEDIEGNEYLRPKGPLEVKYFPSESSVSSDGVRKNVSSDPGSIDVENTWSSPDSLPSRNANLPVSTIDTTPTTIPNNAQHSALEISHTDSPEVSHIVSPDTSQAVSLELEPASYGLASGQCFPNLNQNKETQNSDVSSRVTFQYFLLYSLYSSFFHSRFHHQILRLISQRREYYIRMSHMCSSYLNKKPNEGLIKSNGSLQ